MNYQTAFGLIGGGLLAFSLTVSSALAQVRDWSEVITFAEDMVERHQLEGLSLVLGHGDETWLELYLGDHQPETTHIMASSTKLVTAAVLLSLVDDGLIDIDERAATTLPHLEALYPEVTLRQMLAHTSGMSRDHGLEHDPMITLRASAEMLALETPTHPAGTALRYGGGGLINAAAWAETVTGQSWRTLYQTRIAQPLNLQDSYYANASAPERGADVLNPTVTGGFIASTRDYHRILAAITSGATPILSDASLDLMLTHQSREADRSNMPGPIPDGGGTALGIWCEDIAESGRCGSVHSLGAYGTLPWIDQQAGVFGLLMINTSLREVIGDLRELQARVREAAQR
jgi:CubicO group peptidase (beta-lactamase class C family)